jgi:chromosome segregation ATPase
LSYLFNFLNLDTTGDNVNLLKKQLTDSQENEQLLNQQIITLQSECQTLEQQLKDHQYSMVSLKTNLQLLSNENEQFKQQYEELQQKNDVLINTNHDLTNRLNDLERQPSPFEFRDTSKQMFQKQTTRRTPIEEVSSMSIDFLIYSCYFLKAQIHTIAPVQSAPSPDMHEEIQQLRTNLSSLTAQCSQLDEANRAWQQFHQSQLEIFRNKLQDWIPLDDNFTLEQIAQQIVIHLNELANNNQSGRKFSNIDMNIKLYFANPALSFNPFSSEKVY